jgi:hypothetical protein
MDKQAKITNMIKVAGIIHLVLKPNLEQIRTRLRAYNVLAKPTLVYRSKVWTIKKKEELGLMASEM